MKQITERDTGIEIIFLDACRDTEVYAYDNSSDIFILKECSNESDDFQYAWISINYVNSTFTDTFETINEAILSVLKDGEFVYEFEDVEELLSWAKNNFDKED
jgi:hypothetical protein